MQDYVTWYGDYEAGNLWAHAKMFFEEGGARLKVMRVTGAAPTAGYLDLDDRQTTPEATLRITAANAGDWSDQIAVAVEDGVTADTFVLKFYLNDVLILTTRDLTDPADAVSYVNTQAILEPLVTASDQSSSGSAPDNNPDVAAATALSAGTDGGAVAEATYTAGLDLLTYPEGPGVVAIPGQTGATIWAALHDHCKDYNRIFYSAFGENDSVATVKGAVAAMYSDADAEYGAYYYPWVKVPDPSYSGLYINVSPEAYVAGARNRAIEKEGPWRAAAGLISEAQYVYDTVAEVDRATGDGLDEKRINAIRKIGNSFRVYGARAVSSDEDNWRYITYRDLMNYLVIAAEARLEDLVFETIDSRGTLFAKIEATLTALLDPIRLAGGLYEAYDADGNMVDPGYSVEVSNAINPTSELALGRVHARVGVRPSAVGDLIMVTITKSNLTSSLA
jgi:hypothetical protein